MRRRDRNPHCAINVAVETLGDQWTLLVLRDIVFHGKHEFGEFLASDEHITTSVLADRLDALVTQGIASKSRSRTDGRRERYYLTDKGLALIPVLIELGTWGARYGPHVTPHPEWRDVAESDPTRLCALVHDAVVRGGSAFVGSDSVIATLQAERTSSAARARP